VAHLDLPHVEYERTGTYEASICADDPTTLRANNELELTLAYDHERVSVLTSSLISHDLCTVRTRVTVDEHEVFEKTWVR